MTEFYFWVNHLFKGSSWNHHCQQRTFIFKSALQYSRDDKSSCEVEIGIKQIGSGLSWMLLSLTSLAA